MKCIKDNKGVTLIELLVVLGIIAVCGPAIAMTTQTIYNMYDSGFAKSLVLKQIDLAATTIVKDINRARTVTPTLPDGFPLVLICYEWNGTTMIDSTVTYNYVTSGGTITRTVGVGGVPAVIARYITSPPATKIVKEVDPSNNYIITINAQYNNNPSEKGIYQAQQRVP